jgi:hypothetical protein
LGLSKEIIETMTDPGTDFPDEPSIEPEPARTIVK